MNCWCSSSSFQRTTKVASFSGDTIFLKEFTLPNAQTKPIIGWREWVKFPDLGIGFIKAKVDTGARTSSLHAYEVEVVKMRGKEYVHFSVYTEQRKSNPSIRTKAEILEYRNVKSSNGVSTKRPVILTTIKILGELWPIELTLANRDEMGFRMLLGRESFRGRALVDANKSYYSDKPIKKKATKGKSK